MWLYIPSYCKFSEQIKLRVFVSLWLFWFKNLLR